MRAFLFDLPLFMELAKQKSFTRAAASLGIGVSTLSRRIRELEEEMGTPLFHRSTRVVSLSESGQTLYQHGEAIAAEAENARAAMAGNLENPSGVVRVAMVPDMYHFFLRGSLARFVEQWPEIKLHVTFSERAVDLYTEPYDLDIRVGPMADSGLTVRRIRTTTTALYASPRLLDHHPKPRRPQDIAQLPCIALSRQGNLWRLTRGKRAETVAINPTHITNNINVLHEFIFAGQGVSLMESSPAVFHGRETELIRLLPEWSGPSFPMNVILVNRQVPYRVRLFIDYVIDFFDNLEKRTQE